MTLQFFPLFIKRLNFFANLQQNPMSIKLIKFSKSIFIFYVMKFFIIIILIEFSLVIRGIRKVTKRLALVVDEKNKKYLVAS